MARLFEQRGVLSVEPRPLSGADFECLDERRLRDYFGRVRQQEVPEDDDGSAWGDLLELTEVMADGAAVHGEAVRFALSAVRAGGDPRARAGG